MKKGAFITIEGPDGSGKSTLIAGLAPRLADYFGDQVVFTREPGGDPIAEDIRQLILADKTTTMDDGTEAILFAASRRQHLVSKILPALSQGKLVICDRFVDSSIAYQGYGRQLGAQAVAQLNDFATQGLTPDLTLYLDLPAQAGLARIFQGRNQEINRLDQESLAFHQRVVAGYQALCQANPDRIKRLDASQSPADILDQAWQVLQLNCPQLFSD
ncbi:thymidylate kinase [Aerococcus urinaehominis]|uniref:Thymidylate kinase n=1 Tax=Aerococcus urinaehominis TaxID=128944 RepID=A0A0X8FKZ4_9LACT|nr:dTMP kinase [Aerococcus urinaehominis]AMB99225.1 thymidylate kinase [Aerococcus urinaehominis]SDM31833.1 thymidylate kinase [Aerococcus urinaehominis]